MKRLLTISFYSFARQLNKHKMPNIRELKKQMQKQNMSIINNNSANNPGDLPQNSFLKKEETKEVKTQFPNEQLFHFQTKLEKKVLQMLNQGIDENQIIQKLSLNKISYQEHLQQHQLQIDLGDHQSEQDKKNRMVRQIQEKQLSVINKIVSDHRHNYKELSLGSKFKNKGIDQEQKYIKKEYIMSKIRKRIPLNLTFKEYEKRLSEKQNNLISIESTQNKKHGLSALKDLVVNEDESVRDDPTILQMRIFKGQTYIQAIQRIKKAKQEKRKERQLVATVKRQTLGFQESKDSQQILKDKDEEYYVEKGIKEFSSVESLSPEDKKILEGGEKDLKDSYDMSDIFLDEQYDSQILKDEKKQIYKQSSFAKSEKKLIQMQNKLKSHGISYDLEEIESMNKDLLFTEKKMREQQLQHQKYLQKKEKKKKAKELMNKIHKQKLRDDLNYEKNLKEKYEDSKYDVFNLQENFKTAKEEQLMRKSTILDQNKQSKIHYVKLERKLKNFIYSYLYQGLYNPNSNITQQIELQEILFNNKKTVINIFWKLKHPSNNQKNNEQQAKKIDKYLNSSGNYISAKLTQVFGLRYGPSIRFHFDKILDKTVQTINELKEHKMQIIDLQIQNLKKKGLVKTKQEEKETKQKLIGVANENMENYHNRKILLSRGFRKRQKISDIKDHKEKVKKKERQQKLWQQIERL